MLMPKKIKYRKHQKGRIKGISARGTKFSFGFFALVSLSAGFISSKQLEAARIALNKHVKKTSKIWIRFFPDKPITKKPAETRMGKGKGPVHEWVAVIRPGRILYEIDDIEEKIAKKAMKSAQAKLPVKTKFISYATETL